MPLIKQLLKDRLKKLTDAQPVKRYRVDYEEARRIADLVSCNPLVIMSLQKKYGKDRVSGLYSYLKDLPNLDKKRAIGLMVWKLKQK